MLYKKWENRSNDNDGDTEEEYDDPNHSQQQMTALKQSTGELDEHCCGHYVLSIRSFAPGNAACVMWSRK
jgi:hypothetical protein